MENTSDGRNFYKQAVSLIDILKAGRAVRHVRFNLDKR